MRVVCLLKYENIARERTNSLISVVAFLGCAATIKCSHYDWYEFSCNSRFNNIKMAVIFAILLMN